jgi:hypothetical protein
MQRQLFRRWTTHQAALPYGSLTGLLALLHGATCAELRGLAITDIYTAAQAVQLGRRPAPTPLDPATWTALQRCLHHRAQLGTANQHVLVTRRPRAHRTRRRPTTSAAS